MRNIHHIMVATDGSEGSSRAIDAGAEIAKAIGGTLSIVTVGTARYADEQIQFARVEGDVADAAETFARQILSDAEKQVQRAGIGAPKINLVWGDPAEAIIDVAREEKADAIVVGRRGRGQLSGLLLGSVSQKLATLAP
ncbi:MAG TPA: universal stress protein, partial [Terriglobales bacterium]|nr:universal stress protein [Terriglobales bacterium]